jgi:hypothetical protein
MAFNKLKKNEVSKSFGIKILWVDLSILLGIICILAYPIA